MFLAKCMVIRHVSVSSLWAFSEDTSRQVAANRHVETPLEALLVRPAHRQRANA
jgi:hypothetical protein